MKILVVDIGGTHVKVLATGQTERRAFASGPKLTPREMVDGVKALATGWEYDRVSIGYPAPVNNGLPAAEPPHLGPGWVEFDFETAFGCPVRLINDAAMQALGGYNGGKMLFLGLGTSLGAAMIVDGNVVPLELGHMPYKKGLYEDYVGDTALAEHGKKRWRNAVEDVVAVFVAAFMPDDTVIGGGNAEHLKELPENCRVGANANAFAGGFRMWDSGVASQPAKAETKSKSSSKPKPSRRSAPRPKGGK